ncbi:MAG: histidine kinase [Myxococcales bacterium]|nr:histidine kinase [Myxococcales bacterium]MBL0194597.1 histidine kinase [Myxococcales bacterium]HQY65274.1 histidine kinase [Polyangiaceae bacterium]
MDDAAYPANAANAANAPSASPRRRRAALRLPPETNVLQSTMAAILAPRRAVPIVVVMVPLLFIQHVYSRATGALLLGALMCGTFLVVAPTLWRHLFPMGRESANPARSALIYGGVGVALIVGIGRGLSDLVGMGTTFLTTRPSLLVEVALFWVGGWGLARDIDFEENLRRERARAEELERARDHAELIALKSHLDPHFLFNTLNAIAEWCRADGRVAERAILQLSGMLRTVMSGIEEDEWPIAKELELCDALFSMYLVRDPEMFTYVREVPADLPAVSVPPMLLLPLAENAMKHGPSRGHRGEVRLVVRVLGDEHDEIELRVENPGRFAGPREGSTGLGIVHKRLALAYPERGAFSIRADGDRTVATLKLPLSPERSSRT